MGYIKVGLLVSMEFGKKGTVELFNLLYEERIGIDLFYETAEREKGSWRKSEKLSVFLDALKKRGINPLFLPIFSNKIKVSYRCALLILNYHSQDFLGKQKHCFHLI